MTLHADFELPFPPEGCRIDNRCPDPRKVEILGLGGPLVFSSRPVTPLTVDPQWQLIGKDRFFGFLDLPGQGGRISVVAENTFLRDDSMEVFLVCELVARSHLPIAILFRIPSYWQLNQLSFGV